MDPQLQSLGLQLADVGVRNTAGSIADRVATAKARKKDQETIAELEEIVTGLISDKSELVRIAQAFEEELVAQRISANDIEYISIKFVPLLRQLLESAAVSNGEDTAKVEEMINLVQPLLSVETVTVLQLLGFNFRRAIGEPLTELVSKLILARTQGDPDTMLEIQRLTLERENTYLQLAQDPEALARLAALSGESQ
jgi:hypothetical protein